jgi:membrane protein implicated in regulation of membrane protease activity
MLFWYWLIISGLLFIIEITTLTTFFLFFGIATLIMGAITFTVPNMSAIPQTLMFGSLSLVSMFSSYYIFKRNTLRNSDKADINSSRMTQYIGKSFKLATSSTAGIAKVQIGDTQWRVIVEDAKLGDMVIITGVKSTSFIATKQSV